MGTEPLDQSSQIDSAQVGTVEQIDPASGSIPPDSSTSLALSYSTEDLLRRVSGSSGRSEIDPTRFGQRPAICSRGWCKDLRTARPGVGLRADPKQFCSATLAR